MFFINIPNNVNPIARFHLTTNEKTEYFRCIISEQFTGSNMLTITGLSRITPETAGFFKKQGSMSFKHVRIRRRHPEVFLGKGVLKICSKFTGEHPSRSVISTKLQSNFIGITLQHGCSPVNLLHIFGTPFTKNTSGWLLLYDV